MFKSVKTNLFLFVALIGAITMVAQQPDVSDVELAQFADAYINLQVENQKIEQEMITLIEDEGFDVERFNQIHEANTDPTKDYGVTEEEKKKHAGVMSKIQEMQPEMEKKAIKGIEDTGLTFEKYQALAMAIQQDQQLQQRLQTILIERQNR
ncbi:MAG: DUF4168 domain-containing protein [Bacteroidetes bacterium]|nr:DUF4168 domain-containing protein [Bacteroidota bacterium]